MPDDYKGELIFTDGVIEVFLAVAGKMAHIHVETDRITPSLYKKWLSDFDEIGVALMDRGINEVWTVLDINEVKGAKWVEMFGFEATLVDRENGLVAFHRDFTENN